MKAHSVEGDGMRSSVRNTPSAFDFTLHIGVKSMNTSQEKKKNTEDFNTH